MSGKSATIALAVAAGALTLTGCSVAGPGAIPPPPPKVGAQKVALVNILGGPAIEVPGARSGGTVQVYEPGEVGPLDASAGLTPAARAAFPLLARQLTGYRWEGDRMQLVGDLATDTGTTPDRKNWKFTLREDLTYENGRPVTAADIKHAIERSYAFPGAPLNQLRQWLVGRSTPAGAYPGPYGGWHLPSIETPDEKTIVFHLDQARPEFPFATADPVTAPVPADADTRQAYGQRPLASGPYRVDPDSDQLRLVRNTRWRQASDPIRHQHVDGFDFRQDVEPAEIQRRLLAAEGPDRRALSLTQPLTGVSAAGLGARVDLRARSVSDYTQGVHLVHVNTERVTDVRVRRAVAMAFPREAVRQVYGGDNAGDLAGGLLAPTVSGHHPYDLYETGPNGSPAAAARLLARARTPRPNLTYAFPDDQLGHRQAQLVATALTRAGVRVRPLPLPVADYRGAINDPNRPWDLAWADLRPEWASAAMVLTPLYDGRVPGPASADLSRLNDEWVNSELDRLNDYPDDLEDAYQEWGEFEEALMDQHAPTIPVYHDRHVALHGPDLASVTIDPTGRVSLLDVFVRTAG